MARPKTDPAHTEREALIGIAELAASIASILRQTGRGRYNSERQLRSWLSVEGVQFTVADIAPALALLEATGRLMRPEVGQGIPRPGRPPEHAPEAATEAVEDATKTAAEAIVRALTAGNGRLGICDRVELTERLLDDGVDLEPEAVDEALCWMEDGSHPRYRARRYPPIRQRSQLDPHPPERWALEQLRLY